MEFSLIKPSELRELAISQPFFGRPVTQKTKSAFLEIFFEFSNNMLSILICDLIESLHPSVIKAYGSDGAPHAGGRRRRPGGGSSSGYLPMSTSLPSGIPLPSSSTDNFHSLMNVMTEENSDNIINTRMVILLRAAKEDGDQLAVEDASLHSAMKNMLTVTGVNGRTGVVLTLPECNDNTAANNEQQNLTVSHNGRMLGFPQNMAQTGEQMYQFGASSSSARPLNYMNPGVGQPSWMPSRPTFSHYGNLLENQF